MTGRGSSNQAPQLAGIQAGHRLLASLSAQPEFVLIPLAFVFHFAWEMLQDPLYAGLASRPHAEVREQCLMATYGDVAITLTAYYLSSLFGRSRFWFLGVRRAPPAIWFAVGLVLTTVLELCATRVVGRWSYGPLMPIVPILRIGLAPVLQWIFIPAMLVFLMNRHFRGMQPFERDMQ